MGHSHEDRSANYKRGSLTLTGSIAMGTGVMIGAGIFALTGQVAELAGGLFPLAFIAAAVVVAFSAYSYIKVCNEYPSARGIAMILKKAYGPGVVTAGGSLVSGLSFDSLVGDGSADQARGGPDGFLAAVALSILAYKGFTTITNSGDEIKEPKKNVGRSIIVVLDKVPEQRPT